MDRSLPSIALHHPCCPSSTIIRAECPHFVPSPRYPRQPSGPSWRRGCMHVLWWTLTQLRSGLPVSSWGLRSLINAEWSGTRHSHGPGLQGLDCFILSARPSRFSKWQHWDNYKLQAHAVAQGSSSIFITNNNHEELPFQRWVCREWKSRKVSQKKQRGKHSHGPRSRSGFWTLGSDLAAPHLVSWSKYHLQSEDPKRHLESSITTISWTCLTWSCQDSRTLVAHGLQWSTPAQLRTRERPSPRFIGLISPCPPLLIRVDNLFPL